MVVSTNYVFKAIEIAVYTTYMLEMRLQFEYIKLSAEVNYLLQTVS